MRSKVAEFFTQFKKTRLGLVIDSERSPITRGAIVAPAQDITPEVINRIATLTGGLFFAAISQTRADGFLLSRMSRPLHTQSAHPTQQSQALDMCISVEARSGVSTGISASDRAVTLSVLGESLPNPRTIVSPGHIFPVKIKEGGLLVKTALPEAAHDIVTHAGFTDAACFVDLLDAGGQFLSKDAICALAKKEGLPYVHIEDLTSYFLNTHLLVEKISEAKLPTLLAGEVRALIYKSVIHSGEHLVLIKGTLDTTTPVLTRVQTESTLHDVFGGGLRSKKGQIASALSAIGKEGRGVFVYLRKPTEGFLQEEVNPSNSPPQMDIMREYGIGAQILHHIGVKRIKLLTTSTKNLVGLNAFGIEITEQLPL